MLKVEKLKTLSTFIIEFLKDELGGYDDLFVEQINGNISELWRINSGESYAITRLETDLLTGRTVFVLCVYKGKNVIQFCDHVLKIAEKNNWSIRFHTEKIAFAKWMQKQYNFNSIEYVLTRD
tara:strand:- start:2866 stop:3234 length:369 start_codon:yes stop_codon:yes gene_type:complete